MKRLVLIGGGHAHAQVLRRWIAQPLPGVALQVISPAAQTPYSGMVPGWLAGTYAFDEICMDVAGLCAAAGATFLQEELVGLDPDTKRLHLASGEELRYDILSLNVGSTLVAPSSVLSSKATMLALRPLWLLRKTWESFLMTWQTGTAPLQVSAVGGGAAGVESLLAVLARLRRARPDRTVHGALITRSTELLPGFAPSAIRAAHRALQAAGVTVSTGTGWQAPASNEDEHLVLWATGAQAHAWQRDAPRRGTLAVSEQGFIRIDTQLRSLSHPDIFAVGDCAHWAPPLAKAGVYAVRMGPVLDRNLRAGLGHGSVASYRPQAHFLALLSTADGRAIASRGRLALEGGWLWRWKDHIDRRFLQGFAVAGSSLPRSASCDAQETSPTSTPKRDSP